MQQTDGDRMQQIAGPEPATSRQVGGGAECDGCRDVDGVLVRATLTLVCEPESIYLCDACHVSAKRFFKRTDWQRLCAWSDGCRATAEVESEAGAYCLLHAALRDAQDETTVTWRALARAAAPIAVVVALFLLAPGCGS